MSCGLAFQVNALQDNGASLVSPTLSRKIYDSVVMRGHKVNEVLLFY